MYYLGMDGGGTKTAFVLLDEQHQVVATHETGTCYHIEVGMQGAKATIEAGVKALLEKANLPLSAVAFGFFGLPAFGEDSRLLAQMQALPSALLPSTKYRCDNDMVNGWAAGFGGRDGINIVAGTGTIAFGIRGDKRARCGGWGEIFSDEGSAYWIGRKGLQAFTKMSDGRSEKGPLYTLFKSYFGLECDLDISAIVLSQWGGERSKVASVSTLVSEAASLGDKQALSIFHDAASELADIIEGVRGALGFSPDEQVNVSYSGGVFNAGELITGPLSNALHHYCVRYVLQKPLYSPVIGAGLYAAQLAKAVSRG